MTARAALVVRGGWPGHQPVETTDAILPFLEANGFRVRVEDSTAVYADAEAMAATDVVIQSVTMSDIADEEVRGLVAAVAAGTGLTGWHGGIVDSFRAHPEYLLLTGGQFAVHPPRARAEELVGDHTDNAIDYTVDIVPERADHPIVAGLASFPLTSEQYWVLSDSHNDVLATTTLAARDFDAWQEPVTVPAVWTRTWGAGRVVVATPGHDLAVVTDPNVRAIIEKGILWASR